MNGQSTSVGKGGESIIFEDFPSEVMLIIFRYCSDKTLGKLSETCKRFNRLINDFVWEQKSRSCLATNELSEAICLRSYQMLSGVNKCRISINWTLGRYREIFFPSRERHMPWLLLDSKHLWMSKGKRIQAFHRKADGLNLKPLMMLDGHRADVCRFAKTEELMVSGGRDGAICGWSAQDGSLKFYQQDTYKQDIRAVDVSSSYVVVSGSCSGTASVWKMCTEDWSCECACKVNVGDGIWSVAIASSGDIFCIGSSGYKEAPLHLYDLERGKKLMELHTWHKLGAGVLDIHWETSYTFLSAGYDTYLRLWDIRTGEEVQVWEDPYDSVVYCIGSDNLYTMLCGTASHGRVQLWDKRLSRSVQKYFMKAGHSTPVYSLAFDPCNLYTALDTSLHMLDFSVYKNSSEAVLPASRWIF